MKQWFHFWCRAPNPDTVLIIQTPLGVFSAKNLLQNKKRAGSRLISSNRTKAEEVPTVETIEPEPLSAARCRVFKRSNNNKQVTCFVFYFLICFSFSAFIFFFIFIRSLAPTYASQPSSSSHSSPLVFWELNSRLNNVNLSFR